MRYVEKFQDKESLELNIDYRKEPVIGWIPSTWEAAFVNGNFSIRDRLLRHEINPEISKSAFEIEFSEGTIVFDRDLGYRELWLAGGKKRKITPEESAGGFKYRELFSTKSGELAQAVHGREGRSTRIISLIVINVLILITLFIFFWLRRKKSSPV